MRGSNTPDATVAKFRKEYLRTGNARASARAVGLPETTGQDLAKDANKDADFVRARAELLSHGISEVESMLVECARIAAQRIMKEAPEAEDIARIIGEYDLKSLNYHDPRPAYFSGLVNAHRTLVTKSKLDDEDQRPAQVVVNVVTKDEVEVDVADGDDQPGTESSSE